MFIPRGPLNVMIVWFRHHEIYPVTPQYFERQTELGRDF